MENSTNNVNHYAMYFGAYMGIFWVLKFILFPLALSVPFLLVLFIILTLIVPFLGYYYGTLYRDRGCDGGITFSQSFMFFFLMYAYASLIAAMAHYVYFEFIDNGFIAESYKKLIETAATQPNIPVEQIELARAEMSRFSETSSIQITLQVLNIDIMLCAIVGALSSFFLMREKKEQKI